MLGGFTMENTLKQILAELQEVKKGQANIESDIKKIKGSLNELWDKFNFNLELQLEKFSNTKINFDYTLGKLGVHDAKIYKLEKLLDEVIESLRNKENDK